MWRRRWKWRRPRHGKKQKAHDDALLAAQQAQPKDVIEKAVRQAMGAKSKGKSPISMSAIFTTLLVFFVVDAKIEN